MNDQQLNAEQYRAVYHRRGPLLVLAGAGSGKTRVITERIAALVERDVPPGSITAVTFTNKAAREMCERLKSRLGEQVKALRICTFHALGLAMVREHAKLLGRRGNVSVFAIPEQRSAMRSVLQELHLPADSNAVERTLRGVSALKNVLTGSDASLIQVRDRYDELLQQMNAVDFDDLMLLPVRLLSEHRDVCILWQSRARHLLVDEYQDSSRIQYELIRLLAPGDSNLTVVGDDDQSIYGWRGAEVRNLFDLDRDYPGLAVVRLEENYRSTATILHTANTLISHNSARLGKQLRTNLGQGKPVRIWESVSPGEEAERVAADIRAQHSSSSLRWSDFSVLYRASYQAREFELAFRSADIPYHVSGGISFFERSEVQDVLAYLRLIANSDDDLAFMRAVARPRRGVGDRALAALSAEARQDRGSLLDACLSDDCDGHRGQTLQSFGELIVELEHLFLHGEADEAFDAVMDKTGLRSVIKSDAADQDEYDRRMANADELRRWWLRHAEDGGDLSGFLQRIFLLSDADEDDTGNQVRLMTVHAAKGLEFPHVYVVGMEDGSFPHKNAVEENRLEEERRLMYVAMTRARFRLTLSCSRTRRRFGQVENRTPSPFLSEADQTHIRWVDRETDSAEALDEAAAHMAAMHERLSNLSS
ncbi:MAG: ATP-dependent helicase [Mariprofundaceae bacterium]